MLAINKLIVREALRDLGVKEVGNNEGFDNEAFEKFLLETGWQKGWAWCVFAVKKWWLQAYAQYDSRKIHFINHKFSPMALTTWHNFKVDFIWETGNKPMIGAIAIWQTYVDGVGQASGHAAVVESYTRDEIVTIDGNTNAAGSREGQEVARKRRLRTFNIPEKGRHLVLKGFIYPHE